jgi:hypothetical protein
VTPVADGPDAKTTVADLQQQATLVNDLCSNPYADALVIKCNYSEMFRTRGHTTWEMPQDVTVNGKAGGKAVQINQSEERDSDYTITTKDTVTQSTTLTVTGAAGVKFFSIVQTGINVEKKWETSSSSSYEKATTLHIPPKRAGYVCTSQPTWHYDGKLTATAGNTTWTLPQVTADFPDTTKDGVAKIETWTVKTVYPNDPCAGFERGDLQATRGN